MSKTIKMEKGIYTVISADQKSGKIPSKIKVLPFGEWNTMWYGPIVMTRELAEQMVAYFNRGIRNGVPIDIDHDGGRAAGWVSSLTAEDDGLYAEIDWTPYGEQALKSKEYRLFSPEFSFDWIDPQTSVHHGPVFIAGTLTNRPLLKELPFLMSETGGKMKGSELDLTNTNQVVIVLGEEKTMTIQEILAKKVEERTEEEKTFLTEHSADLTEEQKAQLETESKADDTEDASDADSSEDSSEAGDGAGEDGDDSTEDADNAGDESEDAGDTTVEASEDKTVTVKASEIKQLKADQAALLKFKQEQKKKDVEAEVMGLIKGSDGMSRITSKQKEEVTTFLMNADEKTAESFRNIMKNLPGVKISGEIGASEETTDAQKKANEMLASYKKSGLSEVAAQDKLEKEEPELYKQLKEAV